MLIKSNFKDYYDFGMKVDKDRDLVYMRYPRSEILKPYPFFYQCSTGVEVNAGLFEPWGRNNGNYYVQAYTVGFCGKVYLALRFVPGFFHTPKEQRQLSVVCYSLNDVDAFIARYASDKAKADYHKKISSWHLNSVRECLSRRLVDVCQATLQIVFDFYEQQRNNFRHLFEAKRCPVFIAERDCDERSHSIEGKITYHDEIGGLGFAHVFPPYQAYQEIAMFMGNLAEPRRPIPEIDDETMAAAKGFDKHSFRKDKTPRPKPRRRARTRQ